MSLVLVSREALERLLTRSWSMFELLAEDSGYKTRTLEPESELVTLAVEAGLLIPGPLTPGTVPPAPPQHHFDVQRVFELMDACVEHLEADGVDLSEHVDLLASTYRAEGDPRLRCMADTKVIYGTEEQAQAAASRISGRQPMRHYQGHCGHWHVSRDKKVHGAAVAKAFRANYDDDVPF